MQKAFKTMTESNIKENLKAVLSNIERASKNRSAVITTAKSKFVVLILLFFFCRSYNASRQYWLP